MTAINGTVIYREIGNASEALLNWLDERQQLWVIEDDKGTERNYVDNDTPRDASITPMIVEATTGFSLFPEQGGKRIGTYRDLLKAISAQERARVVVTAEVDIEDDETTDEEPTVQELPRGVKVESTEDL